METKKVTPEQIEAADEEVRFIERTIAPAEDTANAYRIGLNYIMQFPHRAQAKKTLQDIQRGAKNLRECLVEFEIAETETAAA